MARSSRDDFSEKTKRILRERVGGRCSNPSCRKETCGPSDKENKSVILGEAAHIRAAAPGGPRYEEAMSAEERSGISNGIWLCRDCARLIDLEVSSYPVQTLLDWKEQAEQRQREYLGHSISLLEKTDENIYPVYLSDPPPSIAEYYISRPLLEQEIREKILEKGKCLLSGIGGIGKTETIKRVLEELMDQECSSTGIQFIIWVSFSNNDLKGSVLEALPEYKSFSDKVRAWKEFWRVLQCYRDRLLLVIDNIEAESSDPELENLSSYPCRVAVTSRRESVGGLETVSIDVLPDDDCIRLFDRHYRGMKDHFALSDVLRMIDYHTIMIELLARTANMEEWTIEELRRKLKDNGFRMSEEQVAGHHEKLRNEKKIIDQLKILFSLTSYQESFKRMVEQVSVIPAIPFRFRDISRWTSIQKKSDLEKMVAAGWLQSDHKFKTTYIMHSVIASAVRAQFEDTLYSDCRHIIYSLANEMYYDSGKHGAEKAWLIPFSWSVSDILKDNLCSENDAAFLTNLANIYDDIGNFAAAKDLYHRIYMIHRSLETGSADLSYDYFNLAQVCMNLDSLDTARDYGEKCLAIRKKLYGPDDLELVNIYSLLGPIYHRLGDWEKAEDYFSKGKEIIERNQEIDPIVSSTLFCDLASFYRDRGFSNDYLKSEELYEECMKRFSDVFPEDHPETAALYENIAVLKQYKGDYEEALKLERKALKIKEKLLSPEHPDIIEAYINLGYIYYLLDRYDESLRSYDTAEEKLRKWQEENSSRMAALYNNKALTLKACGDYERALDLYRKSEKIRLLYLPEDHELVLSARNNIAHTLTETGQYREAIDIFERIIESYRRKTDGKDIDSEFLATLFNNIAEAYRAEKDYDKALSYCTDALKMKETVYGSHSVDYAISLNTMGLILYYQDRLKEAEQSVGAALEIYRIQLPEIHHLTSTAYFNLALIEDKENKDNEALKHYHEALDIDSKLGNIDDMILTAEYIADLYQRNNMKEDEKMYRDWIEELLEEFG